MHVRKTILSVPLLFASGLVIWAATILDMLGISCLVLCLPILFTSLFAWARDSPPAERKHRLRLVLLAVLPAAFALLWKADQSRYLRDIPMLLAGALLIFVPLLGLAWMLSFLFSGGERVSRRTVASAGSCAESRLERALFTTAVVVGLAVFWGVSWFVALRPQEYSHRHPAMARHGRDIWVVATSLSSDRESAGLPPIWPEDLGFTGAESSTDYFRLLLSEASRQAIKRNDCWLAPDQWLRSLCGPGLPEAASAEAFGPENNAWQVVCIGDDAPASTPFLITRNVDLGDTLTPTSQARIIRSGPLKLRDVVWITRGGGVYFLPVRRFRSEWLLSAAYADSDPDALAPTYRIMRP